MPRAESDTHSPGPHTALRSSSSPHETGTESGTTLNVSVASVIELRGGRVARITANVGDVEMFGAYLAAAW